MALKRQQEPLFDREQTAEQISTTINRASHLRPALFTAIKALKKLTGCEAIAIRLHKDGDYPYFVQDGFSRSFIQRENSLLAKGKNGNPIPTCDGSGYALECMCGNVITGNVDYSLSFFTQHGSFWSNNTSILLAKTTDEDRQTATRNFCNYCGYESVALVPIILQGKRSGLIQINDKRKRMFTKDLILYLEMIGQQIGIAVEHLLTKSRLDSALDEIQKLRKIIPICAWCKSIRADSGYWQTVEEYVNSLQEVEFSHSICPSCENSLCDFPNQEAEEDLDDEQKHCI